MEIKATLEKPCLDDDKFHFYAEQSSRNGYEIRETEDEYQAWGYTAEEKAEMEREGIQQLSLTKREVFLALYNDKGITPDQLKAQITSPEALIEFEYATDYYRGNPLINQIGLMLGYTSEDLDYLFINGPDKEGE